MTKTVITEVPEELQPNQVIVDLPRYETPLANSIFRVNPSPQLFTKDDNKLGFLTGDTFAKKFVDELVKVDPDIDLDVRISFSSYTGVLFSTTGEAVAWARKFVDRHFPTTADRLAKQAICSIPASKTEIIWVGGPKYHDLVCKVAATASMKDVVDAQEPISARNRKKR